MKSLNLLAIETSSDYLSLALARGDVVVSRHVQAGQRHAELVLGEIDALLRQAQLVPANLDGIAYGEGPGSFTGLRIACGVVQGLAYARGLPVVGVSTLLALASQCAADKVLACIDARMGEVYHAAYRRRAGGGVNVDGGKLEMIDGPGLCKPQALPVPEGSGWVGVGSGFAAYATVLAARLGPTVVRTEPALLPSAEAVLRLARPRFERGEGADAATALPVYVRDKVALKTGER